MSTFKTVKIIHTMYVCVCVYALLLNCTPETMDFVNHRHKNNNKISRNKTNKDSKHKEETLKESMKEQKK